MLSHQDHVVLNLEDKIRQVRSRLENALGIVQADSKSIIERQSDIAESLQDFNFTTKWVQEQMQQQYIKVVATLTRRYWDQLKVLNIRKRKQIDQFSKEMTMLQKLSDQKHIFQETVEALLNQIFTDEVLVEAENVLNQTQERLSFGEKDKWWNRNLYKTPDLEPREFLDRVGYLLGCFDVFDNIDKKASAKPKSLLLSAKGKY